MQDAGSSLGERGRGKPRWSTRMRTGCYAATLWEGLPSGFEQLGTPKPAQAVECREHLPSELRVVAVMVGSAADAGGREGGRGGGAAPHPPAAGAAAAAACCCWRCCCASWWRVWVTPPWWLCSTVPVRAAISAEGSGAGAQGEMKPGAARAVHHAGGG